MLTVIPTIGEQRCLVDETGWRAIYYAGSEKFLGQDPHVSSADRTNRGLIWSNRPITVRMVGRTDRHRPASAGSPLGSGHSRAADRGRR
jgi:hypothetical protein